MRDAPPELAALLATGQFVLADCYEFLLANGAALRYTTAGVDLQVGGVTYYNTVAIEHGQITEAVGLEVATMTVKIYADASAQIGGIGFNSYLAKGGFYGAYLILRRAFAADWDQPFYSIIRFPGYVSQPQIRRSAAELTVKSPVYLLNTKMPRLIYQASCQRTLYDPGCGRVATAYQVSGIVSAGSTMSLVQTNLSQAQGYFDLGYLDFTSGVLNGVRRTIKAHLGDGSLQVIPPLPAAPAAGDTFHIYPGCDRTMATCLSKFNNLALFAGQPFIPSPETAR